MRSARIIALLAAAVAPLVQGAPANDLVLLADGPKATASWSYKDCGLATDLVQVKSIKLSPDPPVPGKDLTVTAEGVVREQIEEGAYADVTVKLGLIKLLHKQFDICEEARNNNATIQCPVEKDEYTVVQTVALPNEIPKAKFVIQVRGFSVDEENLLCLDINIDFMNRGFFKAIGF